MVAVGLAATAVEVSGGGGGVPRSTTVFGRACGSLSWRGVGPKQNRSEACGKPAREGYACGEEHLSAMLR